MLTEEEIRRIAKKRSMNVGLTEKDYVIDWLLKEVYESNIKHYLIFKGGTAIKKAYFQETWRFSHDLDFTALNLKIGYAELALIDVFSNIETQSSVKLEFKSFHKSRDSVIANVQFLGPLNAKNRIRLDISFDEKIITKPVSKTVNSPYPDISDFNVNVYSLDEILSEKIRSIIQRGKSRDYYDVWLLLKTGKFDLNKISGFVTEKCKLKGIEFRYALLFGKEKLSNAKGFWKLGLKDLVKELPDFDFVVNELKDMLKDI